MITASGVLIISRSTNRVLLLQKKFGKNIGTWGLTGGKNEQGETAWQGLLREVEEEIGLLPNFIKSFPLERFVSSDNGFKFHTYLSIVNDEFLPILSDEHMAWGWFDLKSLPKPIHKGLFQSLKTKTFQSKIETILQIVDLLD